MDHSGEAVVRLVAAHRDPFELLQLAKEVLNQVPPFVDFLVDRERGSAVRALRDDDLGAALVQLIDDPVRIESLVRDQGLKLDILDQGRDADSVVAVSRQQDEADRISERVGQRQDLGGQAAFGAANGLALRPPFAP
jgi:hypothetical protein